MQLLHQSAVYADHGIILLTGSGWRSLSSLFSSFLLMPSQDDARRGYLLRGNTLCQYMTTDSWRAPVAVFLAQEPLREFPAAAQRVVSFPFSVRKSELLLLGCLETAKADMEKIRVPRGEYTLFSLAYNLNTWPNDQQMDMPLEEFAHETNVERYEFILSPERCKEISVLRGDKYILADTPA